MLYKEAKKIDIRVLDITLASFLIEKCGKHHLGIYVWIEQIKDVRNEIFTLSDIHEITDQKLSRTWRKLEGSILGIANVTGSACVVETKKHIMQTKKLTIASDYMLKYEIISGDYWRNKCAKFERAQNQVIEEKAAALNRTMPQQFSRMMKTDCQKTMKGIETLNTMVHMIHVMMKIFGSEENLEMFTEQVKEDLKRILIPVFMHIDIPTSWDKKSFEAIDEFRLNETPEMIIRMKAISIDDINMFAEKANMVLCNVYELRSKINKMMSTLLSEAEFDTTDQTEFGVNLKVQDISGI
ncbi:unnamed protein product [Mytilus edulis]|uniref:Uncharacterized protein n=1 Tax=Mytilus edulis TaxID=6550 RepID=A0A8S3UE57_MYTED|nr:unnamed protein product [Mytilus edulis]